MTDTNTTTTTTTTDQQPQEEDIPLQDGIATQRVVNQSLQDAAGETGHYTGLVTVSDPPLPHCAAGGEMRYSDGSGRYYKGGWHMGQWHGTVRNEAQFPNGDSYVGTYRLDQRHGPGLYRWKDGRTYEGNFEQDLRHGEGLYTWTNQTSYRGEFVQGQREGKGVYKFLDGVYEGDFKRGQYHGYGGKKRRTNMELLWRTIERKEERILCLFLAFAWMDSFEWLCDNLPCAFLSLSFGSFCFSLF